MMKKRKKNSCICDSAIRKLKENKLSTWFSRPKKTMLVITSTAIFFFFPAYNLSLTFCQLSEYPHFYKMKTCKISSRKLKISISPWGRIFSFQPEVKDTYISKKPHPGLKFHPGWISPGLRVTCLLDLNLKIAWITLLKLDWF